MQHNAIASWRCGFSRACFLWMKKGATEVARPEVHAGEVVNSPSMRAHSWA